MEVENNYHGSLTNLAYSIRKYFNLEYKYFCLLINMGLLMKN